MRRFLPLLALVVLLAGCPALNFEPEEGPAPGVTLTAERVAEGVTTFKLSTVDLVERAFLRFIGVDLTENSDECILEGGAVECSTGPFEEFFEVTIGGTVMNDPTLPIGIACLAAGCFEVFLEP